MAERASVYQAVQLGLEGASTPGTIVAAGKRLLDMSINPTPVIVSHRYRPQGSRVTTTTLFEKEHSEASCEGPINFQSLLYLLNSLLMTVSPTTPSGATNARLWTFKPSNFALNPFSTYTVDIGSSAQSERMAFANFMSANLRWSQADANFTAELMGQKTLESATITPAPTDIPALPMDPRAVSVYLGTATGTNQIQTLTPTGTISGGSFTLTVDGVTTAAILFSATAADIQDALEDIQTVGKPNITAAGGPIATVAVTLTFSNQLAGIPMDLITVTSSLTGSSPLVTPTISTPAGMTKLARNTELELTIPQVREYGYTLNEADQSYSYTVDLGFEPSATLSVQHDSVSAAYMTALRARTTQFLKVLCRGGLIETVSGDNYYNSILLTFPFLFRDSPRADKDGTWTADYGLDVIYDPTFASFIEFKVQSGLAAL